MATAPQTFKIYEILNRHFKNEQDAQLFVQQIEEIIEERFESAKTGWLQERI
jgi:hypothetical protein